MKAELIPLEKALNFQIFRLSLLLGRELGKALKDFDLTPERWQILATLWNAKSPLNQTDLAIITLKDKPSISRLVLSMVKSGWVVRKQSSEDSRAYMIRPSAKANNNKEKIISALSGHFAPIFKKLGIKDQENLSDLVLKYTAIIEETAHY